jgi:hypothetical protein
LENTGVSSLKDIITTVVFNNTVLWGCITPRSQNTGLSTSAMLASRNSQAQLQAEAGRQKQVRGSRERTFLMTVNRSSSQGTCCFEHILKTRPFDPCMAHHRHQYFSKAPLQGPHTSKVLLRGTSKPSCRSALPPRSGLKLAHQKLRAKVAPDPSFFAKGRYGSEKGRRFAREESPGQACFKTFLDQPPPEFAGPIARIGNFPRASSDV